jgi:hypothetical protein
VNGCNFTAVTTRPGGHVFPPAKQRRGILTKKFIFHAILVAVFGTLPAQANVGMGADLVSRYVWRGLDFGDGVSIQPYLSYGSGAIEIGAWSSWGITPNGNNENDLYITYVAGPLAITATDYFFPALGEDDSFLDYSATGAHTIELTISYAQGPISLAGAVNLLEPEDDDGESQNSIYAEVGYDLGEMEGIGVSIFAGGGTDDYITENGPIPVTNAGVSMAKGDYWASYIVNLDRESTFLVFGKSF